MANLRIPCAACKCLMKECTEDCIFAPYFPPNQLEKFVTVNKLFDASNISKLLQKIPESQRSDAVNSMALEAEAHIVYPVHGCKGYVAILKDKLKRVEDELKELEQNQYFQMNTSGDEIILGKKLKHATKFLEKLKTRFGDGIEYESFIDILKKCWKDCTPAVKVYQEVVYLFHGHPDLLDEFTQFLPNAVANQLQGNLKQTLKSISKL